MTQLTISNPFRSTRAILWLCGVALLIIGLLVGAVVLPARAPVPGSGGPQIQVPAMQNLPPAEAPKMKLDVEKKP